MATLPTPGADEGVWGPELNEYLLAEHEEDGTHDAAIARAADVTTDIAAAVTAHVALADPHGQYALESTIGAAGGIASLDGGGQVPTAQLPALAITNTTVVADEAAMLALVAQTGDVAIRADFTPRRAFILAGEPATVLANWEALDPATVVTDVNGSTGSVSIPSDGAAGVASLRTLGTGAAQAAAGTAPAAAVAAHEALSPAHAGTAVSINPSGLIVVTTANAQAAVAELDAYLGSLTAAQVAATPAGELIGTDVEAQLAELDARTAADAFLDDLEIATELRDHFMGLSTNGALGWNAVSASGGNVLAGFVTGGGFLLITGATNSAGRGAINLGGVPADAAPVFRAKFRAAVDNLNAAATQEATVRLGLHDTTTGTDATDGFYFEYSPSDTSWHAKTADAGTRTDQDTGIIVDTSLHWFEITCDGAGVARFYIDRASNPAPVVTSNTNIPDAGDTYSPALVIAKSVGTADYRARITRFGMRFERVL